MRMKLTVEDLDESNALMVAQLRKACFEESYRLTDPIDRFDSRSRHILIRFDGSLVAAARTTQGPDGFFREWMGPDTNIPEGQMVVDLGRCCVAEGYRGFGLFSVLCAVGLQVGKSSSASHVVGAVEGDAPTYRTLIGLGFQPHGPRVRELEPGGVAVRVQPLVCTLEGFGDHALLEGVRGAVLKARSRGVTVELGWT